MRRALVLFIVLAVGVLNVPAQRTTGSISGQVTDPQGASVPGAKVAVLQEGTGFKLELTSSEDGSFVALELAPATYKVTIASPGFSTYLTSVTVRVGVATVVNAKLELGAPTTVVTVEGSAVTVDTVRPTVQGVITGDRIDQLPLNGRNFLDLAQLEPGVQVVDGGNFDPTKNQFVGVSIGGRSGRVTRIQVDGVDITDEGVGTTVANISNESIQEFGISQSTLDASTDVTSSGAVNIITRSGSNSFHGSGFGFFRDARLAADQRLDKTQPTRDKPPYDRQILGGRAGGPLLKDRVFWNVDYEHNNQDAQRFTNVPPFPQFSGAFAVPLDETMTSGRADWNVSTRVKAFYRFQHDNNFGVTGFGGTGLSAFGNRNNTNIHVAGIDFGSARWTHSGRFSYVNFNNVIDDANPAAGTPVTIDPGGRPVQVQITGVVTLGPNPLAPQRSYQDNKQSKYDAGAVFGRHALRFGAAWNKIGGAGFASFFGIGPRVRASRNTTTRAFAAANPFSSRGELDPLNYPLNLVRLGNGLGYFSEKSALGFPYGGGTNHRLGFYAHDTWRIRPNFTVNFGLRYNWNSVLSNHDLARTPLLAQFDPSLAVLPRRDANDFAPQAGFAWNVSGNGKTVIRGGAGIYYETNILNNVVFDRVLNIPPGIGNVTPSLSSGVPRVLDPATGAVLFDFTKDCFGGTGSCFNRALGAVIPDVVKAQALYQAASLKLAAGWPPPGVPPAFNTTLTTNGSLLDPNYKTPYGIQMNIGIQRELKPSLVMALDYVRNRGVHFNQVRDRNRIGASDTLHIPTAIAAMNATFNAMGCTTGTTSAKVDCVIGKGGAIARFANNGLGAGSGVDGFAFGGMKRNFRGMGVIEPIGLSLYHGLQFRLTGNIGRWGPIRQLSTNTTYSLSRFNSTGSDQDFLSGSAFNDRPTQFYGPAGLDRTHQLRFSFLIDLPWGFSVSTGTTIRTGLATSIILPLVSGGADEIFYSDTDGDGVAQDPLPGTNRGSFSRDVKAKDINKLIDKFNSTGVGTLSPAAVALVQAGLFTEAQLKNLGAVLQPVKPAPAGQVDNDSGINTDLRLAWRLKIGEHLSIEPIAEIFNLFNFANYAALTASLDGNPGNVNGTTPTARPTRLGAGSGSFAPGTTRAFQFGIRVSF